jgi:hypothetical protein
VSASHSDVTLTHLECDLGHVDNVRSTLRVVLPHAVIQAVDNARKRLGGEESCILLHHYLSPFSTR